MNKITVTKYDKRQTESKASLIRFRIKMLEDKLYGNMVLSKDVRFGWSMQLTMARQELAKLLKIKMPTADAALDTPEED